MADGWGSASSGGLAAASEGGHRGGLPRPPRLSLAVAALTLAVQNGTITAFGVLYLPLIRELGEGRGGVAAVQSAVMLLGGLGAPLAGALLDRWGPRRLFQAGALLAGLGLLLASQASGLAGLVLTWGLLAGAGLAMLGSAPNMVLVAQWFPARPAWAMALADLGTPAGVFLLVPLAQLVADRWGWRPALQALAALLVLLVLPANAAQHRPPATPRSGTGGVGGALRVSTFWWLALLRFSAGIGFALVNTHVVALAVDAGVPPLRAAAAVAAVAVVSLAGRLAVGRLTDRLGAAPALTLAYASGLAGLACLGLLAASRQPVWLAVFVACYGLAQGSSGIVSTAAATAAFPGPAVGAITGWIALASGPGEAVGAWGGGALHDRTGGYAAALGVAAAALGLGLWAVWQARRRET